MKKVTSLSSYSELRMFHASLYENSLTTNHLVENLISHCSYAFFLSGLRGKGIGCYTLRQ